MRFTGPRSRRGGPLQGSSLVAALRCQRTGTIISVIKSDVFRKVALRRERSKSSARAPTTARGGACAPQTLCIDWSKVANNPAQRVRSLRMTALFGCFAKSRPMNLDLSQRTKNNFCFLRVSLQAPPALQAPHKVKIRVPCGLAPYSSFFFAVSTCSISCWISLLAFSAAVFEFRFVFSAAL